MTTLDLHGSPGMAAVYPATALTGDVVSERAVPGCRRAGEGLFSRALGRELMRRSPSLPAFQDDLAAELRGNRQAVLATGARILGALG